MTTYNIAVIGTGSNLSESDAPSMAFHHGRAYRNRDDCDLIACADVVPENATNYATEFGIDHGSAYESHGTMLAEEAIDFVSVCVPPKFHAAIVTDVAEAGGVAGIHCEKPMAYTWTGALEMAEAARDAGVQLTFNHQRRFAAPWQTATTLLESGDIGELERIETWAPNIYDWGTHVVDLCGMFAGEPDPEWVLAGLDYSEENVVYGAHQENQLVAEWAYDNGVTVVATTGERAAIPAFHRLTGTEGLIEVKPHSGPPVRHISPATDGWEDAGSDDEAFFPSVEAAIGNALDCLGTDTAPELGADRALNATELIFGAWESARRRERIDFPLEATGNPLESMVESGALAPK